MREMADRIQAVINTLNSVTVSGFDNMDRMVGCMKVLAEARDAIREITEKTEAANENADAE